MEWPRGRGPPPPQMKKPPKPPPLSPAPGAASLCAVRDPAEEAVVFAGGCREIRRPGRADRVGHLDVLPVELIDALVIGDFDLAGRSLGIQLDDPLAAAGIGGHRQLLIERP